MTGHAVDQSFCWWCLEPDPLLSRVQWLAKVTWRIGTAQLLFGLLLGLASFKYMTSCASLAPCQWAAVANLADGHYRDPNSDDGCAEGDTAQDIDGSDAHFLAPYTFGSMCFPQCEGGEDESCPAGPKGTNNAECKRIDDGHHCVLYCDPQHGLPDQCPAGARCMSFGNGRRGLCLYLPDPDPWPLETKCVEDVEIEPPGEWGVCDISARLAIEAKQAAATTLEEHRQVLRDTCSMVDFKTCLQSRCDQGLAEPGIKTTCDDMQATMRELCEQLGVEPDVGCDTLANCPAFECPWQWSFVFCVPTALAIVSLVCVGCALMQTARKLKKFYAAPVVDVPAEGSQQAATDTWAAENPVAAANVQAAGASVLHAHYPAPPAMELGGLPIQQPQGPQPPMSQQMYAHPAATTSPPALAQAPMGGMAPASTPAPPGGGAFDFLSLPHPSPAN